MGVRSFQEKQKIEGVTISLIKALQQLAPHPDHPHQHGPLFICDAFNQSASRMKRAQAYLADLPKRLGLERELDEKLRDLHQFSALNAMPAPEIAA